MTLPAAILAGGLATRLRPITESIPKALVEIEGRPFAEHQVELLEAHGVTDIVFLLGHLGHMVQETLGDGSRWGVRLRYALDGPRALGTGGAVHGAIAQLGNAFFVLYGDSYLECDYAAIERAFAANGKPGLMTVCRNEDRWDRSNVLLSEGRIVRYDKQRRTDDMRHIDYGLGVFKAEAFAEYPEDEPLDLATVYRDLLARDDLAAFEVPTRFYEIGSPSGLEETRAHIARKKTAVT
jgi:NDP-sugar pyrophosphorylase family protein